MSRFVGYRVEGDSLRLRQIKGCGQMEQVRGILFKAVGFQPDIGGYHVDLKAIYKSVQSKSQQYTVYVLADSDKEYTEIEGERKDG